jgi:hypothetical protein
MNSLFGVLSQPWQESSKQLEYLVAIAVGVHNNCEKYIFM